MSHTKFTTRLQSCIVLLQSCKPVPTCGNHTLFVLVLQWHDNVHQTQVVMFSCSVIRHECRSSAGDYNIRLCFCLQLARKCTLRGLLRFKTATATAIPLEEVETAAEIVKRFVTGVLPSLVTPRPSVLSAEWFQAKWFQACCTWHIPC